MLAHDKHGEEPTTVAGICITWTTEASTGERL